MKTLIDQLSNYADYHRDPRNIVTHYIGVPMIMQAVVILLARLQWGTLGGVPISLALLAAVAAAVYYWRLDGRYGLFMSVLLAAMLALATPIAAQPMGNWLAWGLGLFALGWVIQFIGHYWEGRKPAFFDDVMGLLIGPLFVAAELGFALGLRKEVQAAVEQRSGPVRRRHTVNA
ncbi:MULTISPECIES: Mpo1 family 2-hydroxy fatty acid dioxygenase [Comamonas]|uniref:Protein of uncharacterized function (DUF962) n=1 Tax=Comamonas testosteroni TaxID=285 RepID=A0A8B4S244_COMTE|nr:MULTISPECIES: Mpo1-like protein [Comamonas]EHN63522.1 hypothetical protein CTATCC11996_23057 [Comamonas testosteroni ATCC 11996]QQN69439.1 DUF962 domain-containing protein [Comamonas testosteroni]SUY77164.1 Protein of uncharacterised function (DUF962) [Comamonas testosteroni]